MRVDEARAFPRPAPGRRPGKGGVARDRIAPIDLLEVEVRERRDEPRDAPSRRQDLDGNGDRVAVVFDEVEHGELQIAGGVERLPELSLARRPVAEGDV